MLADPIPRRFQRPLMLKIESRGSTVKQFRIKQPFSPESRYWKLDGEAAQGDRRFRIDRRPAVAGYRLITRDAVRYPKLSLITPN